MLAKNGRIDQKEDIDIDRAIGGRLTEIRLQLGMSQQEFGATIGAPPRSYYYYERGARKYTAENLRRVHEIYGVNLHWLLTGVGTPSITVELEKSMKEALKTLEDETSRSNVELPSHWLPHLGWQIMKVLNEGQDVSGSTIKNWLEIYRAAKS